MYNLELLAAVLEYIESHLCEEIRTEDVTMACFCSRSTLEKMFRCVFHISVRDYIVRRRMTRAARELANEPGKSILDIGVKYGYSTHESFARAFEKIWNCKPSEFRNRKYVELFPRYRILIEKQIAAEQGKEYIMERKQIDISELYDLFQERRDCYFVCCDIKHMMQINEISHKVGDRAILEALNRMEEVAGKEDVVFRIGGDEFCILTNSTEEVYAKGLAEQISRRNGEKVSCEEGESPLVLYTMVTRLGQKRVNYAELFAGLHNTIREGKR